LSNPFHHNPFPVVYRLTATAGVAAGFAFYSEYDDYIPLSPNTTYTFRTYYSGIADFTNNVYSAIHLFNGTTEVAAASAYFQDLPIGSNGGSVQVEFTTGATINRGRLSVGFQTGHACTELVIRAFMLTQTTAANAPAHYNSGTTNSLWDEVTSYVLQADGFVGYSERFNLMPDEATATVVLNNAGRNFTPREITGVQPGDTDGLYLDIGMPVIIQGGGGYVQGPTTRNASFNGWTTLYTGTIKELQIDTGRYRDRKISISCEQGIRSMDRHYGDIGIVPGQSLRQHLKNVFEGGGAYTIWKYPFFQLDNPQFSLDSAVLYGPATILLGSGVGTATTNPGILMDWPQTLSDTIRNVLDFDGGLFFVAPDGLCYFYSRGYLLGAVSSKTWDYEDFAEDVYVYNSEIVNVVELDYTSQPLYLNPSVVTLGSNTLRIPVATDDNITIVYDYNKAAMGTEYSYGNHIGQTLLIKKVSDGSTIGSGVGISFIEEPDMSGRTNNGENTGWGTQVSFRLYNYTGFEVDVTVTVNGEAMLPDENAVPTYIEGPSILKYGRMTKKYDNVYVTDNTLAQAYADQKIAQLAYPQQYFKTMSTFIHSGNFWYLDEPLGAVIEIPYEYQTETVDMLLVIIGKGFSWQPQELRLEFTLGPIV
jgi:hypothetical protein